MSKKIIYGLIVLIVILIIVIMGLNIAFSLSHKNNTGVYIPPTANIDSAPFKNATFQIDSNTVTLVNGLSETPAAPGSATKIVTRYFGDESVGDLNFDGIPDAAFLVTQETGGSGTFFYVVAALKTETGYKYTNAFLVGDRIAPQNTDIVSDELHVNFAERKPGEPFTTAPSQGAVLLLKVTKDGVHEGLMK